MSDWIAFGFWHSYKPSTSQFLTILHYLQAAPVHRCGHGSVQKRPQSSLKKNPITYTQK